MFNDNNEVLIAERPAHKFCPGLWEFPGGKVESHENVLTALKREFQEEIGIQILTAEPWFKFEYFYPDRAVLLDTWLIKKFTGQPQGAEGQIIRWATLDQLPQYEFPEGNKIIIEKLGQLF